ncbi:hypothetical protein EON73_00680 [bacterium]|nr:MAG: hypothetical protein EON73_00680 [bacterium]
MHGRSLYCATFISSRYTIIVMPPVYSVDWGNGTDFSDFSVRHVSVQNFSPEAANLWFASLTKQSFVWRQNYVLQAIQALLWYPKNKVFGRKAKQTLDMHNCTIIHRVCIGIKLKFVNCIKFKFNFFPNFTSCS